MLGAAALAACSAPAPAESRPAAPAAGGAATGAPAKPAEAKPGRRRAGRLGGAKSIKTLVDQTWAELGMNDATAAYNEANKGKVAVELEAGAAGWEPRPWP